MKQHQVGAVLVFKPGISEAEANKALEALKSLLEVRPNVRTFNPEFGHPVFYIP
jgi:hypothetical protein